MSVYAICWSRKEHGDVSLKLIEPKESEEYKVDQHIEFGDYQITGWRVPVEGKAQMTLKFIPNVDLQLDGERDICSPLVCYKFLDGDDYETCIRTFMENCVSNSTGNILSLEQCAILDKLVFLKNGGSLRSAADEAGSLARLYFRLAKTRSISGVLEYLKDVTHFCKRTREFNIVAQHYLTLVMRMIYDNRLFVPFTIFHDLLADKLKGNVIDELKNILDAKMPLDLQPDMDPTLIQANMDALEHEMLYRDYQQGIKLLIGSYQAAFHHTFKKKAVHWNNDMRPSRSRLREVPSLGEEIRETVNECFSDRWNATEDEEIHILFMSFAILFLDDQEASWLRGPADAAKREEFAALVRKVSIDNRLL